MNRPQTQTGRQRRRRGHNNNSCQTQERETNQTGQSKDNTYFGDPLGEVEDGCFRIASINVNNLSPYKDESKDEQLFSDIKRNELDIILMQEIGVNWSQVSRPNQLRERAKFSFEEGTFRTKLSFNEHDNTGTPKQWGGTGVGSYGKLTHYSMGVGADKSGLGRWTWARYRGKDGITLRVVSVYQPSENTTGIISVQAQHKRYFQEKNDDRNPRAAFKEDLATELEQWIDEGDHIILGGDVNEDVLHQNITNLFQPHGMLNAIYDRHGATNVPPTYFRTNSDRVVDGIWITPGIEVKKAGFLEPGEVCGDHSMLWIDVTFNSALGHNPPQPVCPAARRLRLDNSKLVDKYLNAYEKLITQYKLPQRQFHLEANTIIGTPLTAEQQAEADAIDVIRTKCMRKAEKKCRKLKMGMVDFSPEVAQPLRELIFWDLAIRRRKLATEGDAAGKVSPSLWRRTKKRARITEPIGHMSLDDLYTKRREAKAKYKTAKKNHKKLRLKFIDTFEPKERDRLKRTEKQRQLGRWAKRVTGKAVSKSVTKVEHQGHEYTTKQGVESVLLEVNRAKTRASDDTMFMMEPMRSLFGYRNETTAADEVLNGTFVPPEGTPEAGRLLLEALKRPTEAPAPDTQPRTHITTDDHIRAFRRAKERTSAGMSKLHFGMFKAHIKRRKLAEMDASMRSVAYTTGFVYKRWKRGLDVQLLKRVALWLAEKLRTILLLEADFNMNNKALGADAMRMGERNNWFTRDNYGGRKGMQAVEISMNAQLTFDSIWARRGRAVIMSNDAKGCYDRIAHVVVDMALRRLGIPRPALQSMLQAIQEMDHYIRTAFGDSDSHYGQENGVPPQGVLQGNGAGPAGWFCISTLMIRILRDQGFGYKEWSLIRRRALTITCFAFVDDTDLVHATTNPTKPTATLIEEAQTALTLWEGLLRATGGALAPEKSYWYLVEVKLHNGQWQYAKTTDNDYQLYLPGGHQVEKLDVTMSKEALGIQVRPDGGMEAEVEYLKNKVRTWCTLLKTQKIYGYEAWYCLTTTIMKSIEYPLAATSFTREQVDDIMRPLFKTALNMCNIQRHLPRKLLYGPVQYRGSGLRDPYLSQLAYHLLEILKHQDRDTASNDLLQENMDCVQFYIGSDQNFWDLPFELYGHLAPKGWMKSTWKALSTTNLVMRGPTIATPTKRRSDTHLMDAFVHLPNITEEQLHVLQKCRLFLGAATTLSDLCTANGSFIDLDVWEGRPHQSRTPCPIPTATPSPNDWELWRDTLRKLFLPPYSTSRQLRVALGTWTTHTPHGWSWFRNDHTDTVYEQRDTDWISYSRQPSAGNYAQYAQPQPSAPPDINTLCPVSVNKLNAGIRVTSAGSVTTTPIMQPNSLQGLIRKEGSDANWAVKHLQCSDNGANIAQAIRDGSLIVVSDGSLKQGLGTSAFILEAPNRQHTIRGVNKVPGPITDGNSHRCEMAGIYGALLCIKNLCTLHNITEGHIKMACDNLDAVGSLDTTYQAHPKHNNFDLTSAVAHIRRELPISITNFHVKAHQKKAWSSLTRTEQLNEMMDKTAKAYWTHLVTADPTSPMPQPTPHPIKYEGWQIWHDEQKLTRPTPQNIYDTIHKPITQFWWRRHGFVSCAQSQTIDWDTTEATMLKLPHKDRLWITKMSSDNYGVGTTLVNWKFATVATCLRCGEQEETTEHVFCCQAAGAREVFQKSLRRLNKKLKLIHTNRVVRHALVNALSKWQQGTRHILPDNYRDLQQILDAQEQLGWANAFKGLIVKGWQQYQQQHFHQAKYQRSGKKWTQQVVTCLIRIGKEQWRHRNKHKHEIGKPIELALKQHLHTAIVHEFHLGPNTLLPGDKAKLDINLVTLLNRPLHVKKAWWYNVHIARQRFQRIQQHNEELRLESRAASRLVQWLEGRLLHQIPDNETTVPS